MSIVIEHSGDGTTVEGTTREDAAALKRHGFKWSSRQGFWFLPRTWRETTRKMRAQDLAKELGEEAELVFGDAAKSTTAEERADHLVSRAAELGEHHTAKADRLDGEADAQFAKSDAATEGIPFGQPILVGHHSERRHRKAIDDSWRALGKGVEALRASEAAEERARSAAARAEGYDLPPVVGRRVATRKAELGRWRRSVARSSTEGAWHESAVARIAELEADIARDERVLEESGVLRFSKATIAVGDLVKIRNRWYQVTKANPTKVVIQSHGLTLDYLYAEVQDHRKISEG